MTNNNNAGKQARPKAGELIRVSYAPDASSADQMIAVLGQAGIDAWKSGGVKDIYKIGGDTFGEEIMVRPEDLDNARQIISQMTGEYHPDTAPATAGSVRKSILSVLAAAALLFLLLLIRKLFL